MKNCINCLSFGVCKKASEEIKDCSDFEKRHYDTKLVKIEHIILRRLNKEE